MLLVSLILRTVAPNLFGRILISGENEVEEVMLMDKSSKFIKNRAP